LPVLLAGLSWLLAGQLSAQSFALVGAKDREEMTSCIDRMNSIWIADSL
jgi:hypothetical protein